MKSLNCASDDAHQVSHQSGLRICSILLLVVAVYRLLEGLEGLEDVYLVPGIELDGVLQSHLEGCFPHENYQSMFWLAEVVVVVNGSVCHQVSTRPKHMC